MTAGRTPVIYLSAEEVLEINHRILRQMQGQSAPLRDWGTLASAVVRPQNAAFYEGADLVTQAALYMVGIAQNHPFVDGNKRTGFVAGRVFLRINGYDVSIAVDDSELGMQLEQVVQRKTTFEEFVESLRSRLVARN